jgi:hypothetical protein
MLKDRVRNRTRVGSKTERRAAGNEQIKAYKYVSLVSESPHPLKKVPGIRRCRWESEIGRWVKVQ